MVENEAWGAGLLVIDVSIPSSPFLVGSHRKPEDAIGVATSGGYVYVAATNSGMEICRDCAVVVTDGFDSGDTSAWSAAEQ